MATYIVKSNDSLSKIAQAFYGDASKYMVIAEANGISDPDLIHVGDILDVPDDTSGGSSSNLPVPVKIGGDGGVIPTGGGSTVPKADPNKQFMIIALLAATTAGGYWWWTNHGKAMFAKTSEPVAASNPDEDEDEDESDEEDDSEEN